ncbi:unnamed protein product [Cyprideis torosa]|uniref:Uncharacterized protein n=1 Tax=Cyprideis torosa TaxID=163714 RepID=A0A7R8W461_9CRUS|nr:unnamed protein product [Cyprideis torosa]CAG0880315.1 unnamed protein product [Cyprideis torosa]
MSQLAAMSESRTAGLWLPELKDKGRILLQLGGISVGGVQFKGRVIYNPSCPSGPSASASPNAPSAAVGGAPSSSFAPTLRRSPRHHSASSHKASLLPSLGGRVRRNHPHHHPGRFPRAALSVMGQKTSKPSTSYGDFQNHNVIHSANESLGSKLLHKHPIPPRLEMLLDMPRVPLETQVEHAWNSDDRSLNIFVKEADKLTFHRHPVAQSTDCIRGKVGYSRGIHIWEIKWDSRQRGTHAAVGVATKDAPLHLMGYHSLVGLNNHSWGFDLGRNEANHGGTSGYSRRYPVTAKCSNVVIPDTFLVILDMEEGTLAFHADGHYLGVAHKGLRGKTLYPVVSAVWGHCEITMRYHGGLGPDPLRLEDVCRLTIRRHIGSRRLPNALHRLPLPSSMKDFLMYHPKPQFQLPPLPPYVIPIPCPLPHLTDSPCPLTKTTQEEPSPPKQP